MTGTLPSIAALAAAVWLTHAAVPLAARAADSDSARAGDRDVVSVAPLDSVLARFVRGSEVDYGGLARDRGALDRYLAASAAAAPQGLSREARIAFWVNTYNARVLDAVLRRPGLESVLDPGKILGIPTLAFFRETQTSAGRRLSLNDIEHGILREEFAEPRIHFVLNCASASCPELPRRALTAANLEAELVAAARAFLADSAKNRLGRDGRLELSSIFKWFRKDFVRAAGSIEAYVARYWPDPTALPERPRIRFLPYDWSLNGMWK